LLTFLTELVIFANTQFTLWPEMLMYPWLFNHGFLLYRDIVNPYFPLLTWILTLLTKIGGYSPNVYIAFTWGYILAAQIIFLIICMRIFKRKFEVFYAFLIYVLLFIAFEGNGLWFDLICMLPLLVAFYYLIQQKYFTVGLFLGLGLLIKQTVIWTIIGTIIFLISEKKYKKVPHILFPIVVLLSVMVLIFYEQGILPDFYYWTIKQAFGGMQTTPEFVQWPTRRNIIIMIFAFGLPFVYFKKILKDRISKLAVIFFIFTFLFAFPRFGYFHLVAALPFFAIMSVKTILPSKILAAVQLMLIIAVVIFLTPRNLSFSVRFFSPTTIQKDSALSKYFMQNKLPKKPWIDNFPWYKVKP
jgi:hypothetical protein